MVLAQFPKETREIFTSLMELAAENDFLLFMECLLDNVKNLAVSIYIDKKQEKAFVNTLKQKFTDEAQANSLDKLSQMLFNDCNNIWLNFMDKPTKKKESLYTSFCLLFLLQTDYIEPESEEFKAVEEIKN